mgnify:FL=1
MWHVSHTVTPAWIGELGLPSAGGKLPLWHVAHCPVTFTEAGKPAGAQALNPALWQVSQLALDATAID